MILLFLRLEISNSLHALNVSENFCLRNIERLRRNTILRDVIKHKAETVGDKVFMTYIRDFDNEADELNTYRSFFGNFVNKSSIAFLSLIFGGFRIKNE